MHYKEDGITVCDCLDSFPPMTTTQLKQKNQWQITGVISRGKVVELRNLHPEWSCGKIGGEVGVSSSRVQQILESENLKTRAIKIRPPAPPCLKCGTLVPDTGKYKHNKYCSVECRSKETIELICTYCHRLYPMTTAKAKSNQKRVDTGYIKRTWCSHSCSSKAYWDVAYGRTPNTFGYKLITSQGLKREKAK